MAATYVELHAASAFSFLDGASAPEDLVDQAAELGLPAVALAGRNGVYGAPRLHKAAREAGLRALVGAEVVLDGGPEPGLAGTAPGSAGAEAGSAGAEAGRFNGQTRPTPARTVEAAGLRPGRSSLPRATLLVRDRTGYRNLCKLLTAAARGRPMGEARASWDLVAAHAEGLHCLTGGEEGSLAHALAGGRAACGPTAATGPATGGPKAARGAPTAPPASMDDTARPPPPPASPRRAGPSSASPPSSPAASTSSCSVTASATRSTRTAPPPSIAPDLRDR
jgi:DNA polymerase III alpha subunit